MNQKIRIRLKANEPKLVNKSSERIISAIKPTGTQVIGPIPLKTKEERFTVIRSPHVYKKSREQFHLKTHRRLIEIKMSTAAKSNQVFDALMKVELPAGVGVDITE